MKEFTNVRDLIGQISLDLESKAGKVGNTFRTNIRKSLESLGSKGTITVSIEQTHTGSLISLKIEDWVEKKEQDRIAKEFKNLMDRVGATVGTCNGGNAPGGLVVYLNKA